MIRAATPAMARNYLAYSLFFADRLDRPYVDDIVGELMDRKERLEQLVSKKMGQAR